MQRLSRVTALQAALLVGAALSAQQPTAAPTPAPTPPPMEDLRFIRFKISAGDLSSAESILEVHRAEKGEDAEYVRGLAWVARGAALVGDWPAASRYAKEARALAAARLGTPPDYDAHPEATYALGTAIEVEAQALVAAGKKAAAVRLLDDSSRSLAAAPYNLRARIWKRRDQIELVGQKAPGLPRRRPGRRGVRGPRVAARKARRPVLLVGVVRRLQGAGGGIPPHRREICSEGRRVRRPDAVLREGPRRREGGHREDLEGDLRSSRRRRRSDQRRGHGALRRVGDAHVRLRRPQGGGRPPTSPTE